MIERQKLSGYAGKACLVISLMLVSRLLVAQPATGLPYLNTDLPPEVRVNDLVSRMTLEEKVMQMQHTAPAIPRLGIPEYNWWNECLHGVARNGFATVFPQAIAMAATWNPELIRREADVIATEGRAKYAEAISKKQYGIYQGLTFWSPNINIFRDPRWGRGQETYGEDPFLTAEIGKSFVRGLQGNDPKYYKVISTAKHFAVHSGPEPERHRFDAWPSMRDFYDTYIPAFEALVKDAGVYSVMTCYNRVFGTPSSANSFLFEKILRGKWGFKVYVVSDCWAISDMYNFHNFVPTAEKASALSVKAGTDLSCGPEYRSLLKAVELGYVAEQEINIAVRRLFEARFRLGLFDPASMVPYAAITPAMNCLPEHQKLARQVARESIVLLKNDNNTLPLCKVRKLAVIGPYANDTAVLLGNYNGTPVAPVTILQGIRNQALKGGPKILFAEGVERPEVLVRRLQAGLTEDAGIAVAKEKEALVLASKADAIVFVGGISPNLEGEEMDVKIEGFLGGDRTSLDIPAEQQRFLEKLKETGKPVILVLTNGSALAVNWPKENLPAIVEAWYPGEEGGNAVAEVLFGRYNPAGRLPVTFYKSLNDLPAFEDYSMEGRTYRYFRKEPLYPFGYGLSYTTFEYQSMNLKAATLGMNDTLSVSVTIRNSGAVAGDEVVQLYVMQPEKLAGQPIQTLKAFRRVSVPAGQSQTLVLKIPVASLRHFEPAVNDYVVEPGTYEIRIGASSSDIRLKKTIEIL